MPLFAVRALLVLLSFVFAYVYEVELMFRSGQMVGKRVLKIKVFPVDPTETLNRGRASQRFLAQHVTAAFVPVLGLVVGLWRLWDQPYRQCLRDQPYRRCRHDKAPATPVVRLNP